MQMMGLWVDPLCLVILVMLREGGLLAGPQDVGGARRVLTAAVLTYVAAAVTSNLMLLYYLSLARR